MFRSIYGWRIRKEKWNPPTRQYLVSLIACLKRLAITHEDKIIIAIDSRKGNWRKEIIPEYKANRKDIRKEQSDVPWDYWFEEFNKLFERLEVATPFHFITLDKCEADDIIAEACRYYKKNEIIIVSSDSDFEQLAAYPNVKIFSPVSKKYKQVTNPYKVISKKLEKERADNLLKPVLNELDFEKRNLVVNLLSLPKEISSKIIEVLSTLNEKMLINLSLIPFKIAQERFMDIWNKHVKIVEKKKKKKKPTPITLF